MGEDEAEAEWHIGEKKVNLIKRSLAKSNGVIDKAPAYGARGPGFNPSNIRMFFSNVPWAVRKKNGPVCHKW